MSKFGGVLTPRLKNTAGSAPEAIPIPPELRLPMCMHSGTPAIPAVKVGDAVKVGQVIGEADGADSSPVHASVSGTVKGIDTVDTLTGEKAVTVIITSDGSQTPMDDITPVGITNSEEFIAAVKNSGVVGLGGEGFPTAQKLAMAGSGKIEYLLVNCLESEPFITSGTRTMIDDAESVWEGIKLLKTYLKPKNVVLCIENDKPDAVKRIRGISAGVEIRKFAPRYPQGQEKVLVYTATGRIISEGKTAIDEGCIVLNCSTVAAIAKYVKTGMPLVSRCVTVDGCGVNTPKNLIVPIGTPLGALFEYCGGLKEGVRKVVRGGPMTGLAVPNTDVPVLKTTNAVLAFSAEGAVSPEPSVCIKCGRCANVCPMRLIPSYIENAYELGKTEDLKHFKANICIDCGCCAYVCPSKRPLQQVMGLAKEILACDPENQGAKQ